MKYNMPITLMPTISTHSIMRILIDLYFPGSGIAPSIENPSITLYSRSDLTNEQRIFRYNALINHLIFYLSKAYVKDINITGSNIPGPCFENLYECIKVNPCFKATIYLGPENQTFLEEKQMQIIFDINALVTARQKEDKTPTPTNSPFIPVSWPLKLDRDLIFEMTKFYLTNNAIVTEDSRGMETILSINIVGYKEKDTLTRIFRLSSFINHLLSCCQFNNRKYTEINIIEDNIPTEVFENLRQFIVKQASDFQTEIYLGPLNRELNSSQFQILKDINLEIIKRQARTNATDFYLKNPTEKLSKSLNTIYWFNQSLLYPKLTAIAYTRFETVMQQIQSKKTLPRFRDEKSSPLESNVSFDSCLITQTATTQQIFYFKQGKLISSFPDYKTGLDLLIKETLSLKDILNQDPIFTPLIWSPTEKIFTPLPHVQGFHLMTLQHSLANIKAQISVAQGKERGINEEINSLNNRSQILERLSIIAENPKTFSDLDLKEHQLKEGVSFYNEIMNPSIYNLREELSRKQQDLDSIREQLKKLQFQENHLLSEICLLSGAPSDDPVSLTSTGTMTELLTSTTAATTTSSTTVDRSNPASSTQTTAPATSAGTTGLLTSTVTTFGTTKTNITSENTTALPAYIASAPMKLR